MFNAVSGMFLPNGYNPNRYNNSNMQNSSVSPVSVGGYGNGVEPELRIRENPVDKIQQPKVGRGNGPNGECLTCDSRRYVDQSDDSGVSFQTPTHVSPEDSFAAVRAHEMEHRIARRTQH